MRMTALEEYNQHRRNLKVKDKMNIDLKRIEADLAEYAGETKYKVNKSTGPRLAIRETDNLVSFYINPKKIRSQNQLDEVIASCIKSLTWNS